MRGWVRWLPLALVIWLAKRKCERVNYGGSLWAVAFPDVLIKVDA